MCVAVLGPRRPARPVDVEDVKRVHVLIERCLQREMTRPATVEALALLGVDRRFTALVWARLEKENPEYFAAYNARLAAAAAPAGAA